MKKLKDKKLIIKSSHHRHQNYITGTVSVSSFQTLNNDWLDHMFTIYKYLIYTKISSRMIKTRTIKVKSIKNEKMLMAIIITVTITIEIIMIIMIIKICNSIRLIKHKT